MKSQIPNPKSQIFSILILLVLLMPGFVFAQPPTILGYQCKTDPCDFCDLLMVAANVVNFMRDIAVLVATVFIAWSGVEMLLHGFSPSRLAAAKTRFKNAVFGLVIVFAAYMIVFVIVKFFVKPAFVKTIGFDVSFDKSKFVIKCN